MCRPMLEQRGVDLGAQLVERPAEAVGEQRERQPVRVQRRVVLLLPALRAERLGEVAGAVEQAHADHGTSRLEVTSEDAEAAGVLRQHLGDAELREKSAIGRVRLAGDADLLCGPFVPDPALPSWDGQPLRGAARRRHPGRS